MYKSNAASIINVIRNVLNVPDDIVRQPFAAQLHTNQVRQRHSTVTLMAEE